MKKGLGENANLVMIIYIYKYYNKKCIGSFEENDSFIDNLSSRDSNKYESCKDQLIEVKPLRGWSPACIRKKSIYLDVNLYAYSTSCQDRRWLRLSPEKLWLLSRLFICRWSFCSPRMLPQSRAAEIAATHPRLEPLRPPSTSSLSYFTSTHSLQRNSPVLTDALSLKSQRIYWRCSSFSSIVFDAIYQQFIGEVADKV